MSKTTKAKTAKIAKIATTKPKPTKGKTISTKTSTKKLVVTGKNVWKKGGKSVFKDDKKKDSFVKQ